MPLIGNGLHIKDDSTHLSKNKKKPNNDTIFCCGCKKKKLGLETVKKYNGYCYMCYVHFHRKVTEEKNPKSVAGNEQISKNLRLLVWEKFNGRSFDGYCFSCNRPLTFENFHAGHIISRKDGGSATLDNLRPICQSCNCGMGTENMYDYIQRLNLPGIKNINSQKELNINQEENNDSQEELEKQVEELNINEDKNKRLIHQNLLSAINLPKMLIEQGIFQKK